MTLRGHLLLIEAARVLAALAKPEMFVDFLARSTTRALQERWPMFASVSAVELSKLVQGDARFAVRRAESDPQWPLIVALSAPTRAANSEPLPAP
jgi:hypothetical protein